ncbi:MAG: SRPBCC family protein [Bacteroidota bacterium]
MTSAVAITVALTGALSLIVIYYFRAYGIALFFLIPLLIGFGATTLFYYKRNVQKSHQAAFLSLLALYICFLFSSVEGLICISMSLPFALLLTWVGSEISYLIRKKVDKPQILLLILIASIPTTAFVEKDTTPELTSVTTSIEIEASPEEVWHNVVEFPELKAPTEFIFQTGIAYPINAVIKGKGVGAVRHCNFTTGSFVEPITVWDQPRLLSFDVLEQPAPMKEISFWDVDAPHLHDYFVSKRGQFKLIKLANGHTKLEGTTWYYHNIKPAFYWRIWSNYIIHKIHRRVLEHIKANSEH